MMRAPLCISVSAHAFNVAAVVTTSSTSTRCAPRSRVDTDDETSNAPATLRKRSIGVRRVWVSVLRWRDNRSVQTGMRHRDASARAISSLWLNPRSRSLARDSGTGTSAVRSSITSIGQARRTIRSAIPSAAARQPSYLSAWTIAPPAPLGAQHTDRTARTNGGRRSHHRQLCLMCGWPQRTHCGCGSASRRVQQRPHTTPRSCAASGRSHTTQTRGSSRSAMPAAAARRTRSAPCARNEEIGSERSTIVESARDCLAHGVAVRRNAEPSLERERSLLDQHR
jgi:hypothetical protein